MCFFVVLFVCALQREEYDIEGLIHISELSDKRIEHPREVVQEEQELTLRVIKLDRERRRIGLSLKRVDSAEYAEQDLQAAMQEIDALDEEDISVSLTEDVEDFDAALEAEAEGIEETELKVEVSESEELEAEAEEVSLPEAQIEEATAIEEAPIATAEDAGETEVTDEIEGEELEPSEAIAQEERLSETDIVEEATDDTETLEEEIIREVDEVELETQEEVVAESVDQEPEAEQVDEVVDEVETLEDISEGTELDEQEAVPVTDTDKERNTEAETTIEGGIPPVDEEIVSEVVDDGDEGK